MYCLMAFDQEMSVLGHELLRLGRLLAAEAGKRWWHLCNRLLSVEAMGCSPLPHS